MIAADIIILSVFAIVKLRERERHRVDQGKKRKKMDGGWWISFP